MPLRFFSYQINLKKFNLWEHICAHTHFYTYKIKKKWKKLNIWELKYIINCSDLSSSTEFCKCFGPRNVNSRNSLEENCFILLKYIHTYIFNIQYILMKIIFIIPKLRNKLNEVIPILLDLGLFFSYAFS